MINKGIFVSTFDLENYVFDTLSGIFGGIGCVSVCETLGYALAGIFAGEFA